MLVRRARVHEGLSNYTEARIDGYGLVDVENEVGILNEIHPESQRQTGR